MIQNALTLACGSVARIAVALVVTLVVQTLPAHAEQRFILRTPNLFGSGEPTARWVCLLAGCTVRYPLDQNLKQVFLVTTPDLIDPLAFVATLVNLPGVANAEIDHVVQSLADEGGEAPAGLYDRQPVPYYGQSVWRGYAAAARRPAGPGSRSAVVIRPDGPQREGRHHRHRSGSPASGPEPVSRRRV